MIDPAVKSVTPHEKVFRNLLENHQRISDCLARSKSITGRSVRGILYNFLSSPTAGCSDGGVQLAYVAGSAA